MWAGFARLFVRTAIGLLAGYLALAYLVDPYDSGRSTLFSAGAVRPQGLRAGATRPLQARSSAIPTSSSSSPRG
jgi:hypothetical protein